jgi:carboxymethylenebutenolidase
MTATQPDGYLALPTTGSGSPVLVLHAWWGLNDTIKALCNRLADAGFVAFAPDLYHGKVATTIPDAETLGQALDHSQAMTDTWEAARFLAEQTGRQSVAVIGFSLGSAYALGLSAHAPNLVHSVVTFYGAGEGDFTNAQAAYLGHFAENDEYEEQVYIDGLEESLRNAGRPVMFHVYPGTGHWFFEPDRTDAYNEEAANLAWERTLAFLRRPATS